MPSYKDDLVSDLRTRAGYAEKYLAAAAADSTEALLVALRDVADAQTGMGKLAAEAGVNRENMYRMLSKHGNPRLHSLAAILKVLHLRLEFVSIQPLATDADDVSAEEAVVALDGPPSHAEGTPIHSIQPLWVDATSGPHRFDPWQQILAACRFLPAQEPGYRILPAFPYAGYAVDHSIDFVVPQPVPPTIGDTSLQPAL